MIIYKDISLELLNWLVEEKILKMAIKYNSIGTDNILPIIMIIMKETIY